MRRLLHWSVPTRWLAAALVITALVLTVRVHAVLALNEGPEAEQLLEQAHAAYAQGKYAMAFEFAEAAVADSPGAPMVLVKASDYAFVLGMSRYESNEYWHTEAFEAGLEYSARAYELDSSDPEVHRAWAEGLLFAHLYEIPVDTDVLRESWATMPVDSHAEGVYRDTAIRIASKPISK